MMTWQRGTGREQRWPVSLAILAAIGLQLPGAIRLDFPATSLRWVLPSLELALLAALLVSNPGPILRRIPHVRALAVSMVAAINLTNATLAARLASALINGEHVNDPGPLLVAGGSVWLTNVIGFSLWYWELDRGGPGARAQAMHPYPDFLFPQMINPDLAHPEWEPMFVDYLFVSFTNSAAFSPTDTLPLTRRAKLLMMVQSGISISVVALVIARAVNVLQ